MSKAVETRRRILGAARRLLESGGAVSMAAIAKEAGVTRQLLYVHFGGRAKLLLELSRLVDRETRTTEQQARIEGAPDARTALRELVAVEGEVGPQIHSVAAAITRLSAADPDAAMVWRLRERARYRRCLELVQRLEAESLLAAWEADRAARLLWSATSHRAWAELVQDAGWSTATWTRHTADLLERALVAPSGTTAG